MDPLEQLLLQEYGVTDDLFEAGYVLSNGTPVDFSGRSQASGYIRLRDRYIPKRGPERVFGRNLDHRQFPEGFAGLLNTGNGSEMMRKFLEKTGALRVNSSAGFSVYTLPPVEAVASFLMRWRAAFGKERPLHVDALTADGSGAMDSRELEPDLEKVMGFLEGFYEKRHSMGSIFKKKRGPKDWSPSGRKPPGEPISEKFVRQYLETALWSETDGEEPLDKNYSIEDFTPEAIEKAIEDCNEFITKAGKLLDRHGDDEQNGHDFWLTRGGHGAGFWDRGYGKDGDELTALAQEMGEARIVVGGDNRLRFL